jgi:hypothetical protein
LANQGAALLSARALLESNVPKPSPQSDFVVVDDPDPVQQLVRKLGLKRSLDGKEVDDVLHTSPSSRERLVRSGRLPADRIGTQKLSYLSVDVARILLEGRIDPTPLPQQPKPFVKRRPPDPVAAAAARIQKRRRRPRTNPIGRMRNKSA